MFRLALWELFADIIKNPVLSVVENGRVTENLTGSATFQDPLTTSFASPCAIKLLCESISLTGKVPPFIQLAGAIPEITNGDDMVLPVRGDVRTGASTG